MMFLFFSPACVNEEDFDLEKLSSNVDWTPNMIVPVGRANYSLWYLINPHEADSANSTIQLIDGVLHLKHQEKDVFSYDVDEILSFPAQAPGDISVAIPPEVSDLIALQDSALYAIDSLNKYVVDARKALDSTKLAIINTLCNNNDILEGLGQDTILFNSDTILDQFYSDLYDLEVQIPDSSEILIIDTISFDNNTTLSLEANSSDISPIFSEIKLSTAINFDVNNPFSEAIMLQVKFPSSSLLGDTAIYNTTIPGKSHITETWDLPGLTFYFPEPSTQNNLDIEVKATIITSGEPLSYDGGDLEISYGFDEIDFDMAKGDFGQQPFDIGSGDLEMDLEMLEEFEGNFRFEDPRINLTFTSSIGIPFQIMVNLTGVNSDDESQSLDPDPLNPEYPKNEEEVDAGVVSIVGYNKDNSSIVDLMALPPSKNITYSGAITLNPNPVDIASQPNIIKSTSSIAVDMEIDIPMDFKAESLNIQDTVNDVDVSDADMIKYARLVIVAKNGLPFEVTIDKIYLLDENNIRLDSISKATLLSAAEVFPEGHANAGEVNTEKVEEVEHSVEFTQSMIEKLDKTKKLFYRASLSTPKDEDGQAIAAKIKGEDEIEIKMAVQVQADLND